jgi:hypothetical protein
MEQWVQAAAISDLASGIAGVANAVDIARENAAAHGHTSMAWAIDKLVDVPEPGGVTAAKREFCKRVPKRHVRALDRATSAPISGVRGVHVDGETLETKLAKAYVAYWHIVHPSWGSRQRIDVASAPSAIEAIEFALSPQWTRQRAAKLAKLAGMLAHP